MRSTDLTGLFGDGPQGMGAPFKIVQGQLVEFDPSDGSNTVTVNGATLTNVAMLLTGAEVNFASGDAVLLLVLGNTYMIMGKVATVGSQSFGSASIWANSNGVSASGFAIPSGGGQILTTSIPVPSWAGSALFTILGQASVHNTSGTDDDASVQCYINGLAAGGGTFYAQNGHTCFGSNFGSAVRPITMLSSDGVTIPATLNIGLPTGVAYSAFGGNYAQLTLSAIFFRD